MVAASGIGHGLPLPSSMLEACGEEIGALLDEERKTSRDELAAEVRSFGPS